MQVPLTAIGFFNVLIALQLPATETSNWKQKLKRVDFGGAVMLIFAVSTLLIGLSQGLIYHGYHLLRLGVYVRRFRYSYCSYSWR